MCLAVPGKILSLAGDDPLLRTGRVSFGGIVKEVNLAYTPEADIGDYVIVHVGFAISTLSGRSDTDLSPPLCARSVAHGPRAPEPDEGCLAGAVERPVPREPSANLRPRRPARTGRAESPTAPPRVGGSWRSLDSRRAKRCAHRHRDR